MQSGDSEMNKSTLEAATTEGAEPGEITGRHAIDAVRRAATVVPPTTPEADEISLEGLDALIEAAPAANRPVTVPPPLPPQARSHVSGFAPARSAAPRAAAPVVPLVEEDDGGLDSLRPFYKELEGTPERAEVDIADLTLQADNPYLASSLVPPAEKPPATGRAAVGLAAVVAIAAAVVGGYFAFARAPQTPVAPKSVATSAQPAPAPEPAPAARQPEPIAPAPADVAAEPATPVVAAPEAATPEPIAALPAPSTAAAAPAPAAKPVAAPVVEKPLVAKPPTATVEATTAAATSAPAAAVTAPVAAAAEASSVVAPTEAAASPTAAPVAAAEAPSPATAPELAAVAAPTDLPEAPTREQVAAGFDALLPDLQQCAAGKFGVVIIDATLAGTGRIAHALIDGPLFKGTPEGSCMARAVRKARFPQFSQATLKVRYPVKL